MKLSQDKVIWVKVWCSNYWCWGAILGMTYTSNSNDMYFFALALGRLVFRTEWVTKKKTDFK